MTKDQIKQALVKGNITLDRAHLELFGKERNESEAELEKPKAVNEALNLSARAKDIVDRQADVDRCRASEDAIAKYNLNPHRLTTAQRKAATEHADRMQSEVFRLRKELELDPDEP